MGLKGKLPPREEQEKPPEEEKKEEPLLPKVDVSKRDQLAQKIASRQAEQEMETAKKV